MSWYRSLVSEAQDSPLQLCYTIREGRDSRPQTN